MAEKKTTVQITEDNIEQLNIIEIEQSDVKKDIGYNFFVKDTAEFEQFADFRPITNLTAEEAVSKFVELKEQGFSVGIGLNIPKDIVFDDPEGNGITILVTDENKLANFSIFGDNFIKDQNIETQREVLKTRIAAYEDLYEELVKQNIPCKYPQFVFDKKFSLELNNNAKEENINKAENQSQKNEISDNRNKEESSYVISFKKNESAFLKSLDDYLDKGIAPKNNEFIIHKTPEILEKANVPQDEIVLTTGVINKAKNTHNLTNEEIKSAVRSFSDPLIIFDSDKERSENKENSVLVITDIFAQNKKPIAFSLNMDVQRKGYEQRLEVNEIRSIHDRTVIAKNGVNILQEWAEKGLCRYADDKKIAQERLDSFQLPQATLNNILTKTELVNSPEREKLSDDYEMSEKEFANFTNNLQHEEEDFLQGKDQEDDELAAGWANEDFGRTQRLDEIISEIKKSDFKMEVSLEDNLCKIVLTNKNGDEIFSEKETGNSIMPITSNVAAWANDAESENLKKLADEYFNIISEDGVRGGDYVNKVFEKEESQKPEIEPIYFNNLSKEQQEEVIDGYRAADDQEMLDEWQKALHTRLIVNTDDRKMRKMSYRQIETATDVAQNPPTDEWIGEYLQKNKVNFNTEYWQDIFAEIEQNTSNQETFSLEEIEKEKQLIQEKILQQKEELNNPSNAKEFAVYPESKQEIQDYIETLENLSDDDIKNLIIWKKKNQKENEELHNEVAEQIISELQKKNIPQNEELLSYNEMHPTYTITNKETKRQTTIQPTGKLSENIKTLGKLNNLSEANNVIEKIKSSGFYILSTISRVVIYNDDKYYDFDSGSLGKFNIETKSFDYDFDSRKLNEWDFKKYIDGGLKITKQMKEFEKIGIYDNTPLAGLTKKEVGEICFGLWEAEDKGLLDYDEEVFHSGRYPAYPGDDFVTDYLLENQTKYNFEELKEHFLSKEKDVQITPVSLGEILDVMEMKPEVTPDGKIKLYDSQRQEYIDNRYTLADSDENIWTFSDAAEIFERLDIYINDYYIHDMEEQLEAGGVTLIGNETLKDLCDYAKEQIEAGITTVSQDELNLAMGIVRPDTVIMPEGFIEPEQTTTFTLQDVTAEQIKELKEHLSMNGYDVLWEDSENQNESKFNTSLDEESWISTILDERNISYTRSEKKTKPKELYKLDSEKEFAKPVLNKKDKATNFVLEKLKSAGIEVVTDEDEFNRILKSADRLQKMTEDLSELQKLNQNIKNQQAEIQAEKAKSDNLAKEEKAVNEFNFDVFVKEIQKYQEVFPKNQSIKLDDLEYENGQYRNFKLFIGKNEDEHLNLFYTNQGTSQNGKLVWSNNQYNFFDITENRFLQNNANNQFHLNQIQDVLEISKDLLSKKNYILQIHEELKTCLESMKSRQADILENLIKENTEKKESLENKTEQIVRMQKQEARKNILEWATKENYDKAFLNSSSKISEIFGKETKAVGVLPPEINQIFPSITDYNLYAQKDYFIDHWVNHHSELTESIFDELQNVLDNYDDIYKDTENNTVVFVKQEGRLNDFVVIEQKDNKLVFYDSTFLRKGIPSRLEKITPAREQEQNVVEVRHTSSTAEQGLSDPAAGISTLNDVSLEGSTPLSQNPKGNTAVAISDVNDNLNISQNTDKSIIQKMSLSSDRENVYGFAYDGKIYLNPDFLNSNVAVHEYTHLWDEYTRRTNPELWQKGMNIFKGTKFFNEVKNDPNYADIAGDDNLVLSEVHARICGEMAQEILERIAKEDGEITKDKAIDWNKEIDQYIYENFESSRTLNDGREIKSTGYGAFGLVVDVNAIRSWFAQPIKDLMSGKDISLQQEKSTSGNIEFEKHSILEECNKIIDKYTNTHFTEQEQKLVNKYENEESDRHQVLMSLCNMKYIHCTTKDKDGYWEINKGKEISANEARKLMSYDDFASGIDRASFHITAGRTANDGSFVYFNDSERKRDIKPYELSKENIELLSKYENLGGLKENIPKTVLEQLSNNNNELTAEDLKNAKTLLPKEQYQVVLRYSQGEEGEHFKGILKEISSKAKAIKGKSEILTEDEKHPLAFKYTLGNSRFYFSEWDGEDELFGYVVLNGDTQNSEWGYTSLEELKNAGGKDRNGFPVMAEMTFYGLEYTIEKQISVDYPELSEKMGFAPKLNHNEELISEFGKEIFETLQSRKLEQNAYNICCAAQFVIRTMDSSEKREIFSIMEKCGCKGKNGKSNTEDFLTEVLKAENNTASSIYDRQRLYEKINRSCPQKKPEATKDIRRQESDYEIEI